MIKPILKLFLCSYLTALSFSSIAQNINSYSQFLIDVQKLVSEKKFHQAYQLSQEQNQYLGEPTYDYLLGVSALKLNHTAEAIFAFERTIESNPKWYEARLFLARAYMLVKNFPAAQNQALILVNSSMAPNTIKTSAQALLDRVALQSKRAGDFYSQNIEFALGVDGNVNAGTTEDTIIIPEIGEFLLSPESKSTDDSYAKLNYSGKYSYPINQQSTVVINANAGWYKFAELSQYDRVNAHFSAAYHYDIGSINWHVQASTTPLILDSELYRAESAITLGADFALSDGITLFAAFSGGELNNRFDDKLDNTFYAINTGVSYSTQHWFNRFSVNVKNEDADLTQGEFNSRQSTSVYYQANTQLAKNWQLLSLAGYQWINYQEDHPLFLQERADNLLMLSATVRYLVSRDFALQLTTNYQDKSSNIALFEYDRLDINLSASYSF